MIGSIKNGVVVLVGTWVFVTVCLAQSSTTRTILESVTVSNETDNCVVQGALIRYIVKWLKTDQIESDIRIIVNVKGTKGRDVSFEFYKKEELAAYRRFDILPDNCTDRLDAVSLAIALAIDHTVLDKLENLTEGPTVVPTTSQAQTSDPSNEESIAVKDIQDSTHSIDKKSTDTYSVEQTSEESSRILSNQSQKLEKNSQIPDQRYPHEETKNFIGIRGFAGIASLFEVLPGTTIGGIGGVSLSFAEMTNLRISGIFTANDETPLGNGVAALHLIAGRLDGCLHWPNDFTDFDFCAGAAVGALFLKGKYFEQNRETERPWVAALGQVAMSWPRKSVVGLRFSLDGVVSLLRSRLQVVDSDGGTIDQLQIPQIGALASLQLFVVFQ